MGRVGYLQVFNISMASGKIVQVALPIRSEQLFLYSVPKRFREAIAIGKRVFVPLGNRKAIGYVVGHGEKQEVDFKLKDIIDILDDAPLFDERRLEFLRRISEYYMAPLGIVLKFAHPLGLGKSVGKIVRITKDGQSHLQKSDSDILEKKILQTLFLEGEIASEKLIELIGKALFENLNSLKRRGYIEFDYRVISDEKVKYEKIYSVSCSTEIVSEIKEKKPAKGAILEFISIHGSAPHSELRELFGNFTAHVKWLVDNALVSVEQKEIRRDPYGILDVEAEPPKRLTQDQHIAMEKILPYVKRGEYRCFLLHGVTGSGKTEVYLRVVNEVIARGKQAIVLVPEIALTPLLVKRFCARFGDAVAVIHSALSDAERFDAWRRARGGDLSVVIGARSAVFSPLENLGLVVVDEEHESSYKQNEAPCYSARDAAVMLATIYACPVLLGSATPSVESYANAIRGKYEYLSLPARVASSRLPDVELVDMKNVNETVFSPRLKDALVENFDCGNQTILFINRRGFSNFLICGECGELFRCPNCSVTLTFHKKDNSIKCHYCGIDQEFENICSGCGAEYMGRGLGTQKVNEQVKSILPDARVFVMDRDYTSGKTKLLDLYRKLESGDVDVLIGTQMVAKGHDLSGVTLVGILSADHMLGMPDFRSGERTFQVLTQVAGRTGRGKKPGKVILQTYNPEHPSIRFAITHNSSGFLEEELEFRESLGQPPFSRFVSFRMNGLDEKKTRDFAERTKHTAERFLRKLPLGSLKVLGPSEAPIYKLRNRFRWQVIFVSGNLGLLRSYASALYDSLKKHDSGIKLVIDIDPYDFM